MTAADCLLSRLPRRPDRRSVPGLGGSLPRLQGLGRPARLVRPPGPGRLLRLLRALHLPHPVRQATIPRQAILRAAQPPLPEVPGYARTRRPRQPVRPTRHLRTARTRTGRQRLRRRRQPGRFTLGRRPRQPGPGLPGHAPTRRPSQPVRPTRRPRTVTTRTGRPRLRRRKHPRPFTPSRRPRQPGLAAAGPARAHPRLPVPARPATRPGRPPPHHIRPRPGMTTVDRVRTVPVSLTTAVAGLGGRRRTRARRRCPGSRILADDRRPRHRRDLVTPRRPGQGSRPRTRPDRPPRSRATKPA
jgi:hypothetical protein